MHGAIFVPKLVLGFVVNSVSEGWVTVLPVCSFCCKFHVKFFCILKCNNMRTLNYQNISLPNIYYLTPLKINVDYRKAVRHSTHFEVFEALINILMNIAIELNTCLILTFSVILFQKIGPGPVPTLADIGPNLEQNI